MGYQGEDDGRLPGDRAGTQAPDGSLPADELQMATGGYRNPLEPGTTPHRRAAPGETAASGGTRHDVQQAGSVGPRAWPGDRETGSYGPRTGRDSQVPGPGPVSDPAAGRGGERSSLGPRGRRGAPAGASLGPRGRRGTGQFPAAPTGPNLAQEPLPGAAGRGHAPAGPGHGHVPAGRDGVPQPGARGSIAHDSGIAPDMRAGLPARDATAGAESGHEAGRSEAGTGLRRRAGEGGAAPLVPAAGRSAGGRPAGGRPAGGGPAGGGPADGGTAGWAADRRITGEMPGRGPQGYAGASASPDAPPGPGSGRRVPRGAAGGQGLPGQQPSSGHRSRPAPLTPDDAGGAVPQPLPARGTAQDRRPHPARRGTIRGFPPVPGQPEPVYPPGQFSAWNRPSVRAAWLGISRISDGHGEPEAEPGYSQLATSDPSADSTATQTLAAIDDGSWAPLRARRDWGSHAEEAAPLATRRPARPGVSGAAAAALGGTATGDVAAGRRGRQAGQGLAGPHAVGSQSTGPPTTGPPSAAARDASDLADRPGGQRAAAGAGGQPAGARSEAALPAAPAEAAGGRRRSEESGAERPAPARRGRTHKRSNMMMAALLLSPVLVVVLVVVGYVYVTGKHTAASPHPAALATHPLPTASASPTPTLGPWKHIENRTLDTQPLSLKELFPARFTAGLTGVRTIDKASEKCIRALIGSGLQKAIHKAHCTQVLRASYLSGDRKLMATIGVLNLLNVSAAERAGKASGTHQFIKQLAAKHGPTRHLTKGTGLEEADVLGHYLILTWTEFANLHKPSGKKQLAELKKFSTDLITGTANISLSSRMVTGAPRIP